MAHEARIEIYMVPPRECSPNARVHWRKRSRAIKEARTQAELATRAALNAYAPGLTSYCGATTIPVVIDIEVAWHGRRKTMDQDNLIASVKPMIDGVSDALWFSQDDHVRIGEVTQRRGEGTTTLILREVA